MENDTAAAEREPLTLTDKDSYVLRFYEDGLVQNENVDGVRVTFGPLSEDQAVQLQDALFLYVKELRKPLESKREELAREFYGEGYNFIKAHQKAAVDKYAKKELGR